MEEQIRNTINELIAALQEATLRILAIINTLPPEKQKELAPGIEQIQAGLEQAKAGLSTISASMAPADTKAESETTPAKTPVTPASEPKAEPAKAEPKAEQAKAEPKAEHAKAEPKAEPAKAEPAKGEPKAEPAKATPTKAEPKAEPAKATPTKAESKSEPAKAESKSEPAKAESKSEPAKAEPAKAEPAKAKAPEATSAKAEPAKSEPAKAKAEPAKAELSKDALTAQPGQTLPSKKQYLAEGGTVQDTGHKSPDAKGADTQEVMLEGGEEVIPKDKAEAYRPLLKKITDSEGPEKTGLAGPVPPGGYQSGTPGQPALLTEPSPINSIDKKNDDESQGESPAHMADGGEVPGKPAMLSYLQPDKTKDREDVANLRLDKGYQAAATKYIKGKIGGIEKDDPPPLNDGQRHTIEGILYERYLAKHLGEHNPGAGLDFQKIELEKLAKITGKSVEELQGISSVEAKRSGTAKNLRETLKKTYMAEGGTAGHADEEEEGFPVAPKGNDTVAARLEPGEEVIPAEQAEENRPLLKKIAQGDGPVKEEEKSEQGKVPGHMAERGEAQGTPGTLPEESPVHMADGGTVPHMADGGTVSGGGGGAAMAAVGAALAPITGGLSELVGPLLSSVGEITGAFSKIGSMLSAVPESIGKAISAVPEGIGKAISAIPEGISKAISAVPEGISKAISAIPEGVGKAISAIPQGIGKAISAIPQGIGKAISAIPEGISAAISAVPEGIGKAISAIPEGIGKAISAVPEAIGKAFSAISEGVGKAISSVFTGIVKSISAIPDAVKPFVEALNPSSVQNFNQAMRDLMATVGVAFQPLMQVFAGLARQVGGILLPLMQQLAPIFQRLAETVGGILVGVIQTFADGLMAIMPIIDGLMEVFVFLGNVLKPIFAIFQILAAVIQVLLAPFQFLVEIMHGLNDVLSAMMESVTVVVAFIKAFAQVVSEAFKAFIKWTGIGALFEWIAGAIRSFIVAVVKAIAYILSWIPGGKAILNKVKENLAPTRQVAAAQNFQISSFESISKDIAMAAAQAQGGGGKEEKTMADIVGAIIYAQTKSDGWSEKIVNAINKKGQGAVAAVKAVANKAYEANPLKGAGEGIGNWIGNLLYPTT